MTNLTSHPRTVLVALSCVLLCATTATPAGADAQAKRAGKIHACVIKKGPDRGLMRLSHSKKG